MTNFDQKRDKKVFEIILVLKLIYISLCMIAIYSSNKSGYIAKDIVLVLVISSMIMVVMLAYFLWMAYYIKNRMGEKPSIADYVETIILIVIFIIVIMITGLEASEYKLLSLFIVLIGAIQFGKNYSLSIAISISLLIIAIDFFISTENRQIIATIFQTSVENKQALKQALSGYFERDLILISGLSVTSFILGMYVDIENQHSKELKELANVDELTGLYNHRFFQEFLQKSMYDTDVNNGSVSLLFMDIDYFKNFNDINGHQAGDLVLKQIGQILKECIRETDVVARYGGEEFAVILPNTTEDGAIKVGERIRQVVQNTYFKGQENQPDKNITISIGVSSYPKRASNKHQFINTADDALYRAKSFNKNRVESYHSVLDGICKHIEVSEDAVKSLKAFINMINIKDRYTYGHTERVVIYTKWFAEYLKLNEEQKMQLQVSAYLHDIGKLEIPENVLNKKEKLTDEEYQMFRNHPQAGVDLIKDIDQFDQFMPIIKHHHERYDGRGYPDGLKGDEIPYLARLVTIADSFDAMTSNRPYNVRKTHEKGIQELRDHAGTQFDPILVEQFIDMLDKYKQHF
ncbi:MAG: bifunctional diguanylate cyclase/phosphohydrolase [Peptostreptococcaceae bacterium]